MKIRELKRTFQKSEFCCSRKPEFLVLLMYAVSYCIITVFHEPWFDEAQVWQIAKCASLHDLLFVVPHYEGHPAFWSLVLAIPAKLGMPFEISLKLIGFLISLITIYVILFKTKYPRLMRLVIPFTYFVFYQYGIIVRPYGLMLLLFLLLSIIFPVRHEKPWAFIGLLMLLCMTSAYAIVLAGGISICYTWEILQEKRVNRSIKELIRDKRTIALFALLLMAVLLVFQIMPYENTLVTSKNGTSNSFLLCLVIALFTFIGESMLTTGSWFAYDNIGLQQISVNIPEFIIFVILGIIIWNVIICVSSKRALKYIVVPYVMLAVFAALVYFSVHHVGIIYVLFMFWIAILMQDPQRYEIGRSLIDKIAQNERDRKLLRYPALFISIACLVIPVYWTISACSSDIKLEYCPGRSTAAWIKDHNLESCSFMNVWGQGDPSNDILYNNTNIVGLPVTINPYFDHNICMNLNLGKDDEGYMHYRIGTREENTEAIQEWKNHGIPDILLGKVRIEEVYGDDLTYDAYTIVRLLPSNRIWKNQKVTNRIPVFVRNDILEEHSLETLTDAGLNYYMNGIQVTEEMLEQLKNGVPAEEVLKPYLDAMFGEQK